MVVMCWCVMPEVLYVQSLPIKGILELFLPAPAPWAGSCSLKAAPVPLGAPIRSTRQPVLLADLSTHKPFTSNH